MPQNRAQLFIELVSFPSLTELYGSIVIGFGCFAEIAVTCNIHIFVTVHGYGTRIIIGISRSVVSFHPELVSIGVVLYYSIVTLSPTPITFSAT